MGLPSYLTTTREGLEQRARQGCQALALGDGTALCRVLDRYLMYADVADTTLMPHLCMNGYWEAWITLAVARLVQPGWHCVDVGANHGYYTLLMADGAGPAGRVLAFEPNSGLADLLELSAGLNGLAQQIRVRRRAVGDADDLPARLIVPPRRSGDATICREATPLDSTIEVLSSTLNRELEHWPRVDLIKIDAEGMELAIWRGMGHILDRHKQTAVIMEFNVARYPDPGGFLHAIEQAGYRLRYIAHDGSIETASAHQIGAAAPLDWMLFLRREG